MHTSTIPSSRARPWLSVWGSLALLAKETWLVLVWLRVSRCRLPVCLDLTPLRAGEAVDEGQEEQHRDLVQQLRRRRRRQPREFSVIQKEEGTEASGRSTAQLFAGTARMHAAPPTCTPHPNTTPRAFRGPQCVCKQSLVAQLARGSLRGTRTAVLREEPWLVSHGTARTLAAHPACTPHLNTTPRACPGP